MPRYFIRHVQTLDDGLVLAPPWHEAADFELRYWMGKGSMGSLVLPNESVLLMTVDDGCDYEPIQHKTYKYDT